MHSDRRVLPIRPRLSTVYAPIEHLLAMHAVSGFVMPCTRRNQCALSVAFSEKKIYQASIEPRLRVHQA